MGILLHEVIRNGSLKFKGYLMEAARTGNPPSEKLFAVELDEVEKGDATDAKDFLGRTELTGKQRELIQKILQRVSGKGASGAAFLLDTVMGGGKTHTLAYLYYMFRYRSISFARDEIRDILSDLGLKSVPEVEVVLVNGLNLDPRLPLHKQPKFREFFEKDATKDGVVKTIESRGKPVVFVMDELVEYFNKREGGEGLPSERRGLFLSDLSYLRTLIEGVTDTGTSVFVMTIPSDAPGQDKYLAIVNLFRVVIRQAEIVHPIDEKADIPKIIRKQFVESMGKDLPQKAAEWIRDVYRRRGVPVDEEQYQTYYPFNPRLINDIFVNEFSEYKNFQKTRATLVILSRAVADMIRRSEREEFLSPFVNAGDIDLNSIKDMITSDNIFEMQNLQTVVNSDILIPGLKPLERRLATTIYLYSLNKTENRAGADHGLLFDANPSDTMSPADYKNVVDSYFKRQTVFLHYVPENEKYRFRIVPNIWSLIRREAEKVKDYSKQLNQWFSNLEMGDEVEVIYSEMPSTNLQMRKVNLVVAPYTVFEEDKDPEDGVQKFARDRGLLPSSGGYENGIVILYPSSISGLKSLGEAARQAVALQELKKAHKREGATVKALDEVEPDMNIRFTNSVMDCYTKVLFRSKLKTVSHELHLAEKKEEAYARSIRKLLSDGEKVFFVEDLDRLNAKDLFDRLLGERMEMSVRQAYEGIAKNTNLPFLSYEAFRRVIQLGVKNGYIGLASGQTDQEDLTKVTILGAEANPQEEHYILSAPRLEYVKEQLERPKEGPTAGGGTVQPTTSTKTVETAVESGRTTTLERPEELVQVPCESPIRDPAPLIGFMKKVEAKWRTSDKRGRKYELVLSISSSDGEVELKSDTSKIAYVRQLVENLPKAFDAGDYKVRIAVKLDREIAREVSG